MLKKIATFNSITFLISFIFLAFILYAADWDKMQELSHLIQFKIIISAMIIYALFQITRVFQYTASIDSKLLPRFNILYYVMNKHAFYLAVLPVRMGDFYYSSLLKSHTNIAHRTGILSLYIARIYDLFILSILTFIGLITLVNNSEPIITLVLIILGLLSLISLLNLINTLKLLKYSLTRIFCIKKYTIVTVISKNIENLIHEIQKKPIVKIHLTILIATMLNWFGTIILFWIILNMFQLDLSIAQVAFVVAIINIFSLIPIQTIGGFGIRETGLLSALTLLGYSFHESSSYAIIARLVVYLTSLMTLLILMTMIKYFTNIPNYTKKQSSNG